MPFSPSAISILSASFPATTTHDPAARRPHAEDGHKCTPEAQQLTPERDDDPMNRAVLPLLALLLAASHTGTVAAPAPAAATSPPASCQVVDGRADAHCTPGALNPDVTQATIRSTICVSGWTKTVRPPASYTDQLKRQQKITYGEATVPNSQLEEDHLIALGIGGAPHDPANLWPQPRTGSHGAPDKDREEDTLHTAVCSGQMTLANAQATIRNDWTH
jgi:hypothetical protein